MAGTGGRMASANSRRPAAASSSEESGRLPSGGICRSVNRNSGGIEPRQVHHANHSVRVQAGVHPGEQAAHDMPHKNQWAGEVKAVQHDGKLGGDHAVRHGSARLGACVAGPRPGRS
jgi:hypothetical protein